MSFAPSLLPLLVAALATDPRVHNGRENDVTLAPPRVDASIDVDGALDEPVWAQAAMLTGFSRFSPVDGHPAEDSTEVLVWYSPTALHIGIRAFEAHGGVHATLADRDRIDGDDHVLVFLDTYHDRRKAFVFAANPLGVQSDGTLDESVGGGGRAFQANLSGAVAALDDIDLSPDFVYQSRGRVTEQGYVIEMRIPFKSIRYQASGTQAWGINVLRQVQHSGFLDSWTPAKRSAASLLGQSGALTELTELHRGLVLDVTPEITARADGADAGDGWSYDADRPQVGGTVRWGITNNLTLNGTVKPDFSQVESDVAQVVYDPRVALFFPEKRPFFLDGLELFDTPANLIYTRRILRPVGAAKLSGKISGTNVGFISAVDDAAGSRTGDEHPVFNLLRVRRDIGGQSTLGMAYTDRIEGSDYNRVADVDARIVFRKIYSLRLQAAGSVTERAGERTRGPLWQASIDRAGRTFGFRYSIAGIDPDFVALSGFISRRGIVNGVIDNKITLYGKPGARIESWTGGIVNNHTWLYDRFTAGEAVADLKWHFNSNFRLRGGWSLGQNVLVESFGYDPSLYADYRIEQPASGGGTELVPYVGTGRLPNLDYVLTVGTPEFERFSAFVMYLWGQDENFFEWSSARIGVWDASLNWRPTDRLRVSGTYAAQSYRRKSDNTLAGQTRIPRLKLEYQIARPVFVRLVGQYVADQRDSLRDDSRTNLPVYVRSPVTGEFERALAYQSNGFSVDWLFSYQPTPGTVLFAGYGSALAEADAFRFSRLRRQNDAFFLKLSYLFRS